MNPESIVFHIPHASTCIPQEYSEDFYKGVLPDNLHLMTDWYTDELFDFGFGERVVFPVSRLVCDPERFREDDQEEMAKIGMGAVYIRGYDLRPIRSVTPGRREEILRQYYDPHHKRLEGAVTRALERTGYCLIIDCHSFSAVPLPYEKDRTRPDFCIGTDPYHTPEHLVASLTETLRQAGYSVSLNKPFSGTIVPLQSYRNDKCVSSIMIEVNRGFYLNGVDKGSRYVKAKRVIRWAVKRLLEVY